MPSNCRYTLRIAAFNDKVPTIRATPNYQPFHFEHTWDVGRAAGRTRRTLRPRRAGIPAWSLRPLHADLARCAAVSPRTLRACVSLRAAVALFALRTFRPVDALYALFPLWPRRETNGAELGLRPRLRLRDGGGNALVDLVARRAAGDEKQSKCEQCNDGAEYAHEEPPFQQVVGRLPGASPNGSPQGGR